MITRKEFVELIDLLNDARQDVASILDDYSFSSKINDKIYSYQEDLLNKIDAALVKYKARLDNEKDPTTPKTEFNDNF